MQRTRGRLLCSVLLLALTLAACTVAGSGVIAPYQVRPLAKLAAIPVRAVGARVLALSPNGAQLAVADQSHGVCLRSIPAAGGDVCARLRLTGVLPVSAAFAPDGRTVALGRDVTPQGAGRVWLVDPRSGMARPVSPSDGRGSAYIGMVWNAASGHLLLMSHSIDQDGARTRLVDVDPVSLIPRVVATATGPYEFQSGNMASNGGRAIFTVFQENQLPPNLVVIDLNTGVRREFGPLGANGTQLVPLAVSPDGRSAIAGSATLEQSGPPRLLELATGRLTAIPGLTGDFVAAAFSPNGAQLAVASTVAGKTVRIAVAGVAGGPARTLRELPSTVMLGSRLTWSALDVLAIDRPVPTMAGDVVGWTLSS